MDKDEYLKQYEDVRCPKCGSDKVHVVPRLFLTVICYKCGEVSFVFPENE